MGITNKEEHLILLLYVQTVLDIFLCKRSKGCTKTKGLEFKYHLTVDSKIKDIFTGDSCDKIKETLKKLFEECDELADIDVYKTPIDVLIKDYRDLREYATNVTCEFIDDEDEMIIV